MSYFYKRSFSFLQRKLLDSGFLESIPSHSFGQCLPHKFHWPVCPRFEINPNHVAKLQEHTFAGSQPPRSTSPLVEGSLEVKLPTIWTDEKQSREEAERRERLEERRVEEKESEERRYRCAKR